MQSTQKSLGISSHVATCRTADTVLEQKAAYLASLQVLATSDASVALRRLKDGQGVISQEVRQHKLALPAKFTFAAQSANSICH